MGRGAIMWRVYVAYEEDRWLGEIEEHCGGIKAA